MRGCVGHDGAGVLVEKNKSVLVAVFVRGGIFGQNDVVSCKRFAEAFRYVGFIGGIVIRWFCGLWLVGLASARSILYHRA